MSKLAIIGRQVYSDAQTRRVNIRRYRQTVAEVHGTWCTKNDARALFPVGARSVKMAIRKTSIFGEVYLFSDTVVCSFTEAAFGEISASIWCPKTCPICNIFLQRWLLWTLRGAAEHDSINNGTVKFVVSYLVVFKQVEVSTILASVESTGSWLHADTCPVFVRWAVLEIL